MDIDQLNALVRFYQNKLAASELECGQLSVRNAELEIENATLKQAATAEAPSEDPQPEQE